MVKRLREFNGREGLDVAVKLMRPVGRLIAGRKSFDVEGKSLFEIFSGLFEEHPDEVYELMAVLSGENPASFDCTGAEALGNLSLMITDPDLLAFFGLRRSISESSVSASESTEGSETSAASSDTASNGTGKK